MVADTNLQVWLETNANTTPSIVVPYVQSSEEKKIHYELHAIKKGRAGTSEVSQSGIVRVLAKMPTALSGMALSASKDDTCQIVLILAEGGVPVGNYHFDCPR
ncbi:curli-like amyloid fiber formation chaperone CsgH [Paralcaligenes ureilyticus]|uniref:Curli assembly protein CsgC n=1 Tax=Paralcaligenes ureilyticus TaxID=627131 RepID=A0A4R3MBB7_9BURK|nr:curli-like amyloid fiber formation chaperone CsgH [Paralcaligenes ureilyticus]TCT10432.1 curli production protein [Paralcaligenes ureilyticus]